MNSIKIIKKCWAGLILSIMLGSAVVAQAQVLGTTGTTFNLTAQPGYIYTPDGSALLVWGYALNGGQMSYPGPTLIVNQGDTITISLASQLTQADGITPVPVSMIFPGQEAVSATGGTAGVFTQESTGAADTVTYTFTASNAGTYYYQSGTNMELQTEMGLFGAIVVRPPVAKQAYNHAATRYDYEYLLVLSEMDPKVHDAVDAGLTATIDNTTYAPVYWFINGRNGPDTMSDANVPWMPNQPYNALPRVTPGKTALVRFINMSRDMHPFHTHGNDFLQIARDGHLLESISGAGPDLGVKDYTLSSVPGATFDVLWAWTGEKLGWDVFGTNAQLAATDHMYNHQCNGLDVASPGFDPVTKEYCPDHGKPLPVTLPGLQDLTFGGFYSGSPFLGSFGSLPPGEGGLNLNAGMFYMWHSHTEREITNNDIYPGGMLTMMIVEPPWVTIP
ncbi:MAG: multicopper oxidase domain-containing protein [Gammaproteobacteria bacterium]|nr:multicopper oxidase domain-containing protein [Gammaproteobacteria bacterium]